MNKLKISIFLTCYIVSHVYFFKQVKLESFTQDISMKVFLSMTIASLYSHFHQVYFSKAWTKFILVFLIAFNVLNYAFSNKYEHLIMQNYHRASLIDNMFYCKEEGDTTSQANYFLAKMSEAGFTLKSDPVRATEVKQMGDETECMLRNKNEPILYYWYRLTLRYKEKWKKMWSSYSSLNYYEYLLQQGNSFFAYMRVISDFTEEKRIYRILWVDNKDLPFVKTILFDKLHTNAITLNGIEGSCEQNLNVILDSKDKRLARADLFCESVDVISDQKNAMKDFYKEYGFEPMSINTTLCDQHRRKSLVLDFCLPKLEEGASKRMHLTEIERALSLNKYDSLEEGIHFMSRKKLDIILEEGSFLAYEALTLIDPRKLELNNNLPDSFYEEKVLKGIKNATSSF